MFEYESKEFTTQAAMNKEKKKLIEELCGYLGVERNGIRLQQGNIKLFGLTSEGNWIPLTGVIGDFPDKIRGKGYALFKLKCRLQKNN